MWVGENPAVMNERGDKGAGRRGRERKRERTAKLSGQMCLCKCMLFRRRKPAFVTHDNESSLSDTRLDASLLLQPTLVIASQSNEVACKCFHRFWIALRFPWRFCWIFANVRPLLNTSSQKLEEIPRRILLIFMYVSCWIIDRRMYMELIKIDQIDFRSVINELDLTLSLI
jgi:hypothetical protein